MTDGLTNEQKDALKAMVALVNEATKRIVEVTFPESYDQMLANVVALKFLANTAYSLLDDEGKDMANNLIMAQTMAMGAALAQREDGARH